MSLPALPALFRRRPINLLVPPMALVERALRRRWWTEVRVDNPNEPVEVATEGSSQQTLSDGVGDTITRRYEIDLTDATLSPAEILEEFRKSPDRFSPTEYAAFSETELAAGDRFTIRLAGPWNGPVEVVDVSADRIRLVTLDGHMEAGHIDFCAIDDSAGPRFRIQSTAKAGDTGFWIIHDVLPFGKWVQTDMWSRVLESAAEIGGSKRLPKVQVRTVRHGQD